MHQEMPIYWHQEMSNASRNAIIIKKLAKLWIIWVVQCPEVAKKF